MPCYDKKLEASRQDFFNDVYSTRDVDCVITTGELELMMRDKDWDLSVPVEGEEIDRAPHGDPPSPSSFDSGSSTNTDEVNLPELVAHPGSSSGSYLHALIAAITHDSPAALELNVKAVRSSDYEEYVLTERESGAVVFRGAKCYGFRNLQNLVRKVGRDAGLQVGRGAAGRVSGGIRGRAVRMKKGEVVDTKYDYVEVMACPGGCVNGGGQLRPPNVDEEGFKRDWEASGVKLDEDGEFGRIQGQGAKWGDKEWTKKVEAAYWHDLPTPPPSPRLDGKSCGPLKPLKDEKTRLADKAAARILNETCHPKDTLAFSWADDIDPPAEKLRRKYFRTQYRAVEGEVIGLAVKW